MGWNRIGGRYVWARIEYGEGMHGLGKNRGQGMHGVG